MIFTKEESVRLSKALQVAEWLYRAARDSTEIHQHPQVERLAAQLVSSGMDQMSKLCKLSVAQFREHLVSCEINIRDRIYLQEEFEVLKGPCGGYGFTYYMSGAFVYHNINLRITDPTEVSRRLMVEWNTVLVVSTVLALCSVEPFYSPMFEDDIAGRSTPVLHGMTFGGAVVMFLCSSLLCMYCIGSLMSMQTRKCRQWVNANAQFLVLPPTFLFAGIGLCILGITEVGTARYPGHFGEAGDFVVGFAMLFLIFLLMYVVRRSNSITPRTVRHFIPGAIHQFFYFARETYCDQDEGLTSVSSGSSEAVTPASGLLCMQQRSLFADENIVMDGEMPYLPFATSRDHRHPDKAGPPPRGIASHVFDFQMRGCSFLGSECDTAGMCDPAMEESRTMPAIFEESTEPMKPM